MLRCKHVCDSTLKRTRWRQKKITLKDFKRTTAETKEPFGEGKQIRLGQSKKTFKSVCAEIQCSRRSWPNLQEIAKSYEHKQETLRGWDSTQISTYSTQKYPKIGFTTFFRNKETNAALRKGVLGYDKIKKKTLGGKAGTNTFKLNHNMNHMTLDSGSNSGHIIVGPTLSPIPTDKN